MSVSKQRYGAGIWHFATYVDRYATDGYGPPRTLLDMIGQAITARPQLLRPAASRPPENHSVTPNQISQKGWPRGQTNRAAGITAHRTGFSI